MTKRAIHDGSDGPITYDDEKSYPRSSFWDKGVTSQIARINEGPVAQLAKNSGSQQKSLTFEETWELVVPGNTGTALMSDHIGGVLVSRVEMVKVGTDREFVDALIYDTNHAANTGELVDILHDPRGSFGVSEGSNNYNFIWDGSDRVRLENTTSDDETFTYRVTEMLRGVLNTPAVQ